VTDPTPPADSILITTKKLLSIDAEDTAFDLDILMHINSVFAILKDLGVGPMDSYFEISDAQPGWSAFVGSNLSSNLVKSYMYSKVRLMFDPPQTSFAIDAIRQNISEMEWRLCSQQEEVRHPWVAPIPSTP
jgi:hypothetical protein